MAETWGPDEHEVHQLLKGRLLGVPLNDIALQRLGVTPGEVLTATSGKSFRIAEVKMHDGEVRVLLDPVDPRPGQLGIVVKASASETDREPAADRPRRFLPCKTCGHPWGWHSPVDRCFNNMFGNGEVCDCRSYVPDHDAPEEESQDG